MWTLSWLGLQREGGNSGVPVRSEGVHVRVYEDGGEPRDVYFIAAHHKPYQLDWLLAAIHNDRDIFLVHVDRKAPREVREAIEAVAKKRPGIVLMPSREVHWGDWSQVASELAAIRAALDMGAWRYFVFLSGQDYPIKPVSELRSALSDSWPRSWVRVWTHARVAAAEPSDPHLSQRLRLRLWGRVAELPIRVRPPRGLETRFKGSNWHILNRELCEWAVESGTARRLARRIRLTFCPDESYFQAVIMNSPFRDERMPDCGRFVIWPGPKTLVADDLEAMVGSSDLFARKFDAAVDVDVLRELARRHQYQESTMPATGGEL